MKTIPLTNSNLLAVVDDQDYAAMSAHNWQLNKRNGAVQRCVRVNGKIVTLYLARQIMGEPEGKMVDHWDHDKLNHRRKNLRVATRSQNGANRKKQKNPSFSKFKGVSLFRGKWTAQIVDGGRKVHLGRFTSEDEAAQAYDSAAPQRFGRFALTNTEEVTPLT